MAEIKERIIFELEDQVTPKINKVNSSIEKLTQKIKRLNQLSNTFKKVTGTTNKTAAQVRNLEDKYRSLTEVIQGGSVVLDKNSREFSVISEKLTNMRNKIDLAKKGFNEFDSSVYAASAELKKLNEEQRKLFERRARLKQMNTQFRQMKSEIDRVANSVRGLTNIFLGLGLSLLFAGLALRNFGLKVLRSLFNTFQRATEGTTAYAETLGRLTAAFEFLKYTIIETFLQSELGEKIINKIVETLGRLADWIQQNPNIATAIVGGAAGLAVLGTALGILGQIIAGISVIPQFISRSITSLGALGTKIINLVKGPEFLKRFDDLAKKLGKTGSAAGKAGSKVGGISKFLKFVGAGSFLTPLKGLLRVFGKLVGVLTIIELVFNFFKGFFEEWNRDVKKATEESEDYAKGIEILSAAFDGLKYILGLVWKAFDAVFKIINEIARAFGAFIGNQLKTAITQLGAFANTYQEARDSGKGIVGSAFDAAKSATEAGKQGSQRNLEIANTASQNLADISGASSSNTLRAALASSTGVGGPSSSPISSVISSGLKSAFSWAKSKLGLARGGIVTSPTTALIGEAGPEAVIPLSRMGETNVGGINVTVNVSQTNASPEMIGNAVLDTLQQSLRRKGLSAGL